MRCEGTIGPKSLVPGPKGTKGPLDLGIPAQKGPRGFWIYGFHPKKAKGPSASRDSGPKELKGLPDLRDSVPKRPEGSMDPSYFPLCPPIPASGHCVRCTVSAAHERMLTLLAKLVKVQPVLEEMLAIVHDDVAQRIQLL